MFVGNDWEPHLKQVVRRYTHLMGSRSPSFYGVVYSSGTRERGQGTGQAKRKGSKERVSAVRSRDRPYTPLLRENSRPEYRYDVVRAVA
jgi:hypothetical protein